MRAIRTFVNSEASEVIEMISAIKTLLGESVDVVDGAA